VLQEEDWAGTWRERGEEGRERGGRWIESNSVEGKIPANSAGFSYIPACEEVNLFVSHIL